MSAASAGVEILDVFEDARRAKAMREIAATLPPPEAPAPDAPVNLHVHTFHSFNYRGWSPSRAVYEARRAGLAAVGTVDFDVLSALDETLAAGDAFGQRAVSSLETRVFWPEYADREINSPGEPGVAYHCGVGFVAAPPADSPAGKTLASLLTRAQARNREVCARVNAAVPEVAVDYDAEVLPLTPSGNATERHLLAAYDARARAVFGDRIDADGRLAAYWAGVLGGTPDEIAGLLRDAAKFRNLIRAKLMKRGGPGYVAPTAASFPQIREVVAMTRAAGALPCAAWLDGSSAGEADAEKLVDDYARLGVRAFCVIPDRNWNLADPAAKAAKLEALTAVMAAARARDLLFAIGTEMNNYGQRTVDAFDAPELAPYVDDFRTGAYALYGHTLMSRAGGRGIGGEWAERTFAGDRSAENAFYAELGRRAPPTRSSLSRLAALPADAPPAAILAVF